MKMIVNATPLIALNKVNQLNFLNNLFSEVIIPQSVYNEVVIQGQEKVGIKGLLNAKSINIKNIPSMTMINLLLLG